MNAKPDPLSEAVAKLLIREPAHASRDGEITTLHYHTERAALEIVIQGHRGDVRNVWVRLSNRLELLWGEEVRIAADYWGWNWLDLFTRKKRQEALDEVLSAIKMNEPSE